MGTDSRREEDRGTAKGRNHGAATEPRRATDAAARRTASRRLRTGLDPATSRRRPPRASLSRPPPAARRRPPTFLLRPRRGHHEGHHQVQRSQEAGGRAPRTPAAAGRGLQPGPGGRGGGGGGGCSSSRPLPHPGRPGAAELEVRRDPSPRGDGSGAGAVVRAVAAVPEERAVVGPGLGLPAWVRVGACARARVSVTASASASPTKSRNGEAAGQARRAAILETGKGRGPRRWPLRGGAERRGPPPPCQHLGGPPVRVFPEDSVSSDSSTRPQNPTGFTDLTGRGGQPHPVTAAGPGRRRERDPSRPGVKMAAGASRRQCRQSQGRLGGHAAQPHWCVGGTRPRLRRRDKPGSSGTAMSKPFRGLGRHPESNANSPCQ